MFIFVSVAKYHFHIYDVSRASSVMFVLFNIKSSVHDIFVMQLGMSALHYAAKEGHDSIVDILMAAEANVDIKNSVSDKNC